MTYNLVAASEVIAFLAEKERSQKIPYAYMSLFYILKIRADVVHYTAENLCLELGVILCACQFLFGMLHRKETV